MLIYNLLEYSKHYSKTTESFCNYYRDEPNSGIGGENNNVNYSIKKSKSFDYKTSIAEKIEAINTTKDAEIVALFKHLSSFWRTLDMPLINFEINLILAWSENCVLTSKVIRDADPDASTAVTTMDNPTNEKFEITGTKLYFPVVTLSTENDK